MGANGDPNDEDLSDTGQSEPEGAGRTSQRSDLSREDVMFLRATRDINENPEEYPKTGGERAAAEATVAAIKHATTLSRNQINYRLGTTTNTRGFVERGLIVSHDPRMTDTGYGPRSAELTDQGRERLEDGLRAYGLVETESRGSPEVMDRLGNLAGRVEDMERSVARLEEQVERLTDRVEAADSRLSRIEESDMGAVEEPHAGRLRTVIDAMPAFYQAFQLIGMDVREIQDADELTDAQVRELLDDVRRALDE